MKIRVSCVYWSLLFTSIVSSALLFLIVACERTHPRQNITPGLDELVIEDNITNGESTKTQLEKETKEAPDITIRSTVETDSNTEYIKNAHISHTENLEASDAVQVKPKKDEEAKTLEENLTQQPNLSHEISETGQTVVLTLVDTAAVELQSLADEPKISSDFRSRSEIKNLSINSDSPPVLAKDNEEPVDRGGKAPPVESELPRKVVNISKNEAVETTSSPTPTDDSAPEVVIVRAELNKVHYGDSNQEFDEDCKDSIPKEDEGEGQGEEVQKVEEATPDSDDIASRSKIAGSGDGASTVAGDTSATSDSNEPHEDIPSFNEWTQKRLEEAEKKKTHPNVSVQTPGSGPGKGVGGMKVRSKNYASPDCGAKIVAVNPEARGARNILVSTRDEYMLNACTNRIWFVVELCEAIQAKKIELANFELFSSSPKDFTVSISDRFPTREWITVGQFTAEDERDIQSFHLHPHTFGKFVKVELHSHHGSEHYCPVSLLRVYGTSEFEVLETETDNVDVDSSNEEEHEGEEEEESIDFEGQIGEPSGNLFGSARDAVLNIVRKAAEVLVKTGSLGHNNITKIQESIRGDVMNSSFGSCMTPRYAIICQNCTDDTFARVFEIISCRNRYLDALLNIELLDLALRGSELCRGRGIYIPPKRRKRKDDIRNLEDSGMLDSSKSSLQATFFASLFTPDYIVALCNILATKERRVVVNSSFEIPGSVSENETSAEEVNDSEILKSPKVISPTQTLNIDSTEYKPTGATIKETKQGNFVHVETVDIPTTKMDTSSSGDNIVTNIPTLGMDEWQKESSVPAADFNSQSVEDIRSQEIPTSSSTITVSVPQNVKVPEKQTQDTADVTFPADATFTSSGDNQGVDDLTSESTEIPDTMKGAKIDAKSNVDQDAKAKMDNFDQEAKITQDQLNFDSFDFKDLEVDGLLNGNNAASTTPATPNNSSPQQKESVFLRLSNRIKALERNMSLSGQYLEELSRRYKKQVEEMQRSLERAVQAMGEESRKGEERESKRIEEITTLREEINFLSKSVEDLLYDRDSWSTFFTTIGQYALLIIVDIAVVILILSYCRKSEEPFLVDSKRLSKAAVAPHRRSLESFGERNLLKKSKKRRPSEVASYITGNYDELMIDDRNPNQLSKKEKKKKRRKDSAMARIASTEHMKREPVRYKHALNAMPGGTTLPSRRASSEDAPNSCGDRSSINQNRKRPDSAPECPVGWFANDFEKRSHLCSEKSEARTSDKRSLSKSKLEQDSSEVCTMDENVCCEHEIGVSSRVTDQTKQKLSSPSFMKTALGARNKRISSSMSSKQSFNRSSMDPLRSLPESVNSSVGNINGTNGHVDENGDSRSSSATSTLTKKDKKSNGLKKMLRRGTS